MQFSEKLKQLRTAKGLTQEEFAEKVNVSRVAVSKWETGRGYPNLDSLQLLAKVFDTSIDELLSSNDLVQIAKREKNKFAGILNILSFLLLILPIFRSVSNDGQISSTWIFSVNYSSLISFLINLGVILISVFIGIYNTLSCVSFKTKTWLSVGSFVLMILGFALTLQPYPAVFSLTLFVMLLKVSLM